MKLSINIGLFQINGMFDDFLDVMLESVLWLLMWQTADTV